MTPAVIDIYHGNVVHDFSALKAAGVVGVIHKCTQGAHYADPLYAARRKLATDAGLLWGAYAFNTGESVAAQRRAAFWHRQREPFATAAAEVREDAVLFFEGFDLGAVIRPLVF